MYVPSRYSATMSMYTVYLVKGKERLAGGGNAVSFIDQSCRELGPLRPVEIKLMVLVFGMVGGFMVQPWTGIDPRVYLLRTGHALLSARH